MVASVSKGIAVSEVRRVKLGDIKPSPWPGRRISKAKRVKLKDSILTLGLYHPLLVWKGKGVILGGNQRFSVLRELTDAGLSLGEDGLVPIVEVDCTEDQAKAIFVRDNMHDGDWDKTGLGDLLKTMNSDVAKLTGLAGGQIDKLTELAQRVAKISVKDLDVDSNDLDAPVPEVKPKPLKLETRSIILNEIPKEVADAFNAEMARHQAANPGEPKWKALAAMVEASRAVLYKSAQVVPKSKSEAKRLAAMRGEDRPIFDDDEESPAPRKAGKRSGSRAAAANG